MPFLAELTLEFCDVETRGVSREEVVRAAREKPRDPHDWFLTLTRGEEEYMDSTLEDETTFSVRCKEDGKQYRTVAGIREELLEPLFLSFYEHDRAWKTLCAWEELPGKRAFSLGNLFSK
jgi:hypothetical protein